MSTWATPRRAAALAAGVAIVVHLGALANGFAYDDHVLILGDPGIRQLDGLGDRLMQPSWPAAFGDEIGAWRPVTTGSWALVWSVAGESPIAFHAFGVLLHALVSALGVLLLAELVPLAIATLAGLVFAVHPVHTEAVANVAGSAEPLAASFGLIALLLHVRGGRRYGGLRVLGVAGAYALAVLAKEGVAVLPLLIFIIDGARWDVGWKEIGRHTRERLLLYGTLAAVLAAILLVRWDVVGAITAASHPPGAEVLVDAPRSWTVFSTWPHYFRLLFFPLDLAADYGPAVVPIVFSWTPAAVLGAALGLAGFLLAWLLWRRGAPLDPATSTPRTLALSTLWIAAALLPVANVLYLGPVMVAERTLYLPSWGAALAIGWLVAALVTHRPRLGPWVVLAIVGSGAARTVTRVPVWSDTESVMQALIEDHPESGTAWMHLGRRLATEGRPDDALTAFRYAVGFLNSEYRPSTEIGSHLMAMGRPESARFFLERAWREHPEWYTAPGLLAAAELNAGRPERAAAAARAAARLQPENASMHHLLAQALAQLGSWEEAAEARRASLRAGFASSGRSWILLAQELASAGDSAGARAAIDSATARDLSDEEADALRTLRSALVPVSDAGR